MGYAVFVVAPIPALDPKGGTLGVAVVTCTDVVGTRSLAFCR
jgi:hypothetical protein